MMFSRSLIEFRARYVTLQVYVGSMKRLPKLSSGLKNLHVIGFDEVEGLNELNSLEHISFHSCKKLIEIQSLNKLGSLISFSVVNCPSLERLPDLPNTGMLKKIEVKCCDKLDDIQRLEAVESLEHLSIYGCYKIKEIPNLQRLKCLKTIDIHDLKEQTAIHGLEKLKCSDPLRITDCNSFEALPDFFKLAHSGQIPHYVLSGLPNRWIQQDPSCYDSNASSSSTMEVENSAAQILLEFGFVSGGWDGEQSEDSCSTIIRNETSPNQ